MKNAFTMQVFVVLALVQLMTFSSANELSNFHRKTSLDGRTCNGSTVLHSGFMATKTLCCAMCHTHCRCSSCFYDDVTKECEICTEDCHNGAVVTGSSSNFSCYSDGIRMCPDGWMSYQKKCYYFSATSKTYDSARDLCVSMGGELAQPVNSETNNFLKSVIRQYKVWHWWLGLNSQKTAEHWVWDGSGDSNTYDNWMWTNPNKPLTDRCCALWYTYDWGWVDEHCSKTYYVMCEM